MAIQGTFSTTAAGTAAGYAISGSYTASVDLDGTRISAELRGLNKPTYTAHVHDGWCRNGGGAHYKIDPSIAETVEANELWLKFASNAAGEGSASLTSSHVMGGNARSIVLHDPDTKEKIACADILLRIRRGQLANLPGADALGYQFGGPALLANSGPLTSVTVQASGLPGQTNVMCHVHVGTCAEGGLGHYMFEKTTETVASNEIWVELSGATGQGTTQVNHKARVEETRSLVCHDPASKAKVGCADLVQ